jgi:flagellar motor switch protein FliN
VAEAIEYEQFEGQQGGASQVNGDFNGQADLSRLSDIPMELSVEIGRTHMTVGETLDLRVGSVVALERLAGETADLLVNGSAIARGEVVVIEEQYGLRITEILDGQAASSPEGDPGSSPEGEPAQPLAATADGEAPEDDPQASLPPAGDASSSEMDPSRDGDAEEETAAAGEN